MAWEESGCRGDRHTDSMRIWVCDHCFKRFCDDCHSPRLVLEGKPYWIADVKTGRLESTLYYLCGGCKAAYEERNRRKGRRESKIGQNKTSMW